MTSAPKRLPTVFDFSALRLHPNGRSVKQDDARNTDLNHISNVVRTSRGNWVAGDAGGNIGVGKRVKVRREEEEEEIQIGSDKDENDVGGLDEEKTAQIRNGKGKAKQVDEDHDPQEDEESKPRKKRKRDIRTERRRNFFQDLSFLEDYRPGSNATSSYRGFISRHVSPAPSGTLGEPSTSNTLKLSQQDTSRLLQSTSSELPLPSSDLLKCIHHFASSYYTEQGQMLQIARQYRKAKKERQLKRLQMQKGEGVSEASGSRDHSTKPAAKSKCHSEGRESDEDEGMNSSSDDEALYEGSGEEEDRGAREGSRARKLRSYASSKRKPDRSRRYRDMYKMFDGTVLMAIGMLVQEYVSSMLTPKVPPNWERDVRLTWAPGRNETQKTEWELQVEREKEAVFKARQHDENHYRDILEGLDEAVKLEKVRIPKKKRGGATEDGGGRASSDEEQQSGSSQDEQLQGVDEPNEGNAVTEKGTPKAKTKNKPGRKLKRESMKSSKYVTSDIDMGSKGDMANEPLAAGNGTKEKGSKKLRDPVKARRSTKQKSSSKQRGKKGKKSVVSADVLAPEVSPGPHSAVPVPSADSSAPSTSTPPIAPNTPPISHPNPAGPSLITPSSHGILNPDTRAAASPDARSPPTTATPTLPPTTSTNPHAAASASTSATTTSNPESSPLEAARLAASHASSSFSTNLTSSLTDPAPPLSRRRKRKATDLEGSSPAKIVPATQANPEIPISNSEVSTTIPVASANAADDPEVITKAARVPSSTPSHTRSKKRKVVPSEDEPYVVQASPAEGTRRPVRANRKTTKYTR